MFRVYEITNSKRSPKNKRLPPTGSELFDARPDERTMPYFSIVTEQVLSDQRYCQLSTLEKGLFLMLAVHVLWRDNGQTVRHSGMISKRLGVSVHEWEPFEEKLLTIGLLQISPDGNCLVSLDLRQQFLMTLETCNNRRRKS